MAQLNGLRILNGNQRARGLKTVRVVIAALSALVLIIAGLCYWMTEEAHNTADTVECERVYPLPVCAEVGDCVWDYESCTYEPIKGK